MKKISLIISILVLMTSLYAQESYKQNDRQSETIYAGYGGPLFGVTQINGETGLVIGGKGGAMINNRFVFGGLGFGTVNMPEFTGNDLTGNTDAPLYITYGAGGVFFEYLLNQGDFLRFAIPVNFMAGGVHIYEQDTENEIESSAFFVIEPGFNIDLRLSGFYTQSIYVSYRQALGSSLVNFGDDAISGLNVGLIFKFGG